MSTKIEVGDVIRLKQGTIATVIAVENDCINVSWKECGKWYTSYVNISEVEKLERLTSRAFYFSSVSNCFYCLLVNS